MASGLKTISPLDITDSVIVRQPAVEDLVPAWAPGVVYAIGARVRYQHFVYEAGAAAFNSEVPADSPTIWVKTGSTNTWALFNGRSSQTSAFDSTASYGFRFGLGINCVAAIGLSDVQTIRVRLVDPSYGTVYDKLITVGLAPERSDWWEFFFGDWSETGSLGLFTGLPAYPQADVLVDFTGTSRMQVGNLVVGNAKEWGLGVQLGASIGIQDFSRKDPDEYGHRVLVERTYIGWTNLSVPIARKQVSALARYLTASRAKPILFLASSDIDVLNIFGLAKEWSIAVEFYNYSVLDLQVEEI